MRKFLLFVVTVFSFQSHAGSGTDNAFEALFRGLASIGDGKGSKEKVQSHLRITGGYEMASIRDDEFDETKVTGFDKPKGNFGEVDLGGVFALHFGVSKLFDKESKFNFGGGGLKDAEIEMTRYQYGIKIIGPGKVVNPYLGGGYITGPLRLKDTATGDVQTQTLHGLYWNVGLDLLFSSFIGLRLGYQSDDYISETITTMGQNLVIKSRSGKAGLIIHF